jgi:hypothetical protein
MPSTGAFDYPIGISPGGSASDLLMSPAFVTLSAPAGVSDGAAIENQAVSAPGFSAPKGSPTFWALGLLGLVVAVHMVHRFARKREGRALGTFSEETIGMNLGNFFTVGLGAALFILTLKVGANKFAAGTTFAQVANAI